MYNLLLISTFLFLFSCSENSKIIENNENSSKVISQVNECKVVYETYVKKKGEPKSVISERKILDKNPYSQITVVNIQLKCNDDKGDLVNKELLKHTIKSDIDESKNLESLDELLNTINYSGLSEDDPTLSFDKSAEFIRTIDNELIYLNENYISVKKTEDYQLRSSNPIFNVSTLTMEIISGKIFKLDEVIKSEKINTFKKMINDSIKLNHKEYFEYNQGQIEISDCYNINKNGISIYFQSYGNRFATINFKKEFIKDFIKIDFWK